MGASKKELRKGSFQDVVFHEFLCPTSIQQVVFSDCSAWLEHNPKWDANGFWGHLGTSKVKVCNPSFIFYTFCVPMGTPLGTQKSHWGPPGGHLSSQGRLLEGTFYGPTFYMKFGSQK